MTESKPKKSFWRFGGQLDRAYNWSVAIFFVLDCFIQIKQFPSGRLPEAIGRATGQTVVLAIFLFAVFKIISALRT
jgi:hypothetical protein